MVLIGYPWVISLKGSLERIQGTPRGPSWPGSGKGQGWGYGGWCEDIKVVFGYNSKVFVVYMSIKLRYVPDLVPTKISARGLLNQPFLVLT